MRGPSEGAAMTHDEFMGGRRPTTANKPTKSTDEMLELDSAPESLIILLDMSISSWYLMQGDKQNPHSSIIPCSVSIAWGGICRLINAYCIGWPSMEITLLGVHEKQILSLFSGKAEIFDATVASDILRRKETDLDKLAVIVDLPDDATGSTTQWQHGPTMSLALMKAILMINKLNSKQSNNLSNWRILIVDASSQNSYVSQEGQFSACLHAAKAMSRKEHVSQDVASKKSVSRENEQSHRVTIDVCSLQSHYPPILETLATETDGMFLSYPRELLVDSQDHGIGFNPPISVSNSNESESLSFAFPDFLMFHFVATTSLRKQNKHMNARTPNERLMSHACACHHQPTSGIVFLCPCCAAVYCTRSRPPAICKVCSTRFRRKAFNDQTLVDRIS